MMMHSGRLVRFTAQDPCPVCGGHEHMPRGHGVRCYGFRTPAGDYAHCSRPELAGALPMDGAQTFGHYLLGPCRCGYDHRAGVLTWQPMPHTQVLKPRRIDDVPVWRDPAWQLVATFVYRDAHARPLYRVQRWQRTDGTEKRFLQSRFDATAPSGWRAGLGGMDRVPYRLPELLAAAGRLVLIAEGEQAVDRAREAGFVATCNPEGARVGSWRPELTRWFAGRHVVILPDNDDDGRRHGREVTSALARTAASIRWLELPGLEAKGDICDWLDAGGTAGELRALIRAARGWQTPATLPTRIMLSAPGAPALVVSIPPWIGGAPLW